MIFHWEAERAGRGAAPVHGLLLLVQGNVVIKEGLGNLELLWNTACVFPGRVNLCLKNYLPSNTGKSALEKRCSSLQHVHRTIEV